MTARCVAAKRIGALAVVAVVVFACSGSPTNQTPGAGATDTPGGAATDTPGDQTPPPFSGDLAATARALAPPGSTETQKIEAQGVFQLYLMSTMSIADLESFYDAKLPSVGAKDVAKVTSSGSVTYGFTNPDGTVIATTDSAGGGTLIIIGVGTSS